MNKTELIAAIAEQADLSKQQTSHALTAFQKYRYGSHDQRR